MTITEFPLLAQTSSSRTRRARTGSEPSPTDLRLSGFHRSPGGGGRRIRPRRHHPGETPGDGVIDWPIVQKRCEWQEASEARCLSEQHASATLLDEEGRYCLCYCMA